MEVITCRVTVVVNGYAIVCNSIQAKQMSQELQALCRSRAETITVCVRPYARHEMNEVMGIYIYIQCRGDA